MLDPSKKETKRCSKCKRIKPLEEFYKNNTKSCGRQSACKECIKENDKERLKRYRKTNEGRQKEIERSAKTRKKYPERDKARVTARRAIKTGEIKKRACQICGEIKTEMHHPDYSKPLEVVFLCLEHHGKLHREPRELLESLLLAKLIIELEGGSN